MVNKSQKRLTATGRYTDVVMIQIPPHITRQIEKAFKLWQNEKLPGGPDRYLPIKSKEQLFKLLLKGVYSPEELDEQWSKIASKEGGDLIENGLNELQTGAELPHLAELPPILAENMGQVEHVQAAD